MRFSGSNQCAKHCDIKFLFKVTERYIQIQSNLLHSLYNFSVKTVNIILKPVYLKSAKWFYKMLAEASGFTRVNNGGLPGKINKMQ